MFNFKIFKNPIFLVSLFAVFVLLLSLFLSVGFVSAAGMWTHCQGPLTNYDTNYGNYQFDCNNSDSNTYNYYCEETDGQLAYCRSFANPSSDYYDCGVSTVNMITTSTGFLFVNCSTDTQKPSITNFTATPVSTSQIDLSWTAADDVGVTEIQVQRSAGAPWYTLLSPSLVFLLGSPTSYSDTNSLSANQEVCYTLCAYDAMRNQTCTSGYVCATTLSDSTPPSNITNLSVSSCSFSSCSLSWNAPGNDGNVGTASSYDMRYSTSPINNSNWDSATQATGEPAPTSAGTTNSMNISGLSPTTTYYFAIKSSDGANISALSNVPTGTTTAEPDITAPSSASPNLQASRDTTNPSSQINISWIAYTDNVGVAGYRIERCQGVGCSNFVQINTSVATNYSDSGLSPSTSYSYRIRAYDAAIPANVSNYSNIASATTAAPPDTSAPNFTPTSPSDPLPTGTQNAVLRGVTNEGASCRYAASSQSFDSMPPMIQMTTTDGITHSAPLSGLSDNQSYTYYIKCRDGASTPNTSGDFIVSFSVSAPPPDTSPPLISGGQPSGTLPFFPSGSGTVTMSALTNESAYCRYNQAVDTSFDLMAANPLNTNPVGDLLYQKYHFTTLTVSNGANYRYYVRCQDTTAGNTNTSGYLISFSVATPPNVLPTVNLTASPTSGGAPISVSASGSGNDSDGDFPLIYSLDWGDGFSEGYAPNTTVQHTYNNAGSYTVILTVWDARMNINGSGVSDMEYITVNAPQVVVLPPITGGICAVECNDDSECVAGFVCGPSHICILEAAADAGPDRSGEYASLTDGTVFANFPAGTQTVIIGLATDANAECRFAVNQSTNNGEAGVAYNFSGAGITMNQFSTSDYKNHSAIINIGAAKSCSPGTLNSCGYNKEDACPASGKCNSYGFSAVCRNTFGTLEPNTTDHPIRFTIGAPELLACVPGERCPSGLECPASGPFTGRCEPAPYTCLISQYFIRNNIPYLLDICFPSLAT